MTDYIYHKGTSRSTRLGYRDWSGSSRLHGAGNVQEITRNPCGVCGQLECLCRPRFFAGQLLTEDDLNRLDRYIVKKQRLHNRHLHGWGVVCGLELRCDPCDDLVTVTSGYALSPCGEDIVVCQDDRVSVCELIQECLDAERKIDPCEPPRHRSADGCKEEEDEWLLMIRYEEHPSRGIGALRNASAEARCGPCDGVAWGKGVSNESGKSHHQSCGQTVQPQSAQCEPTIVCEGYRYEVCHPPDRSKTSGAMVKRFNECVRPFVDILTRFGTDLKTYKTKEAKELHALCCALKAALIDLLANHAAHNCILLEQILALDCPQPVRRQKYLSIFEERLHVMTDVWFSGVLDCYCRALLPPCETDADPRVVLGKVTVRRKECKVLRVCNWTMERKFATTFPNLQYWLSWLPYGRMLRSYLEKMCCDIQTWIAADLGGLSAMAQPTSEANGAADLAGIVVEIISGKAATMDAQSLFKGIAGLSDDEGQPIMSELERKNLLPSLLIKHFGANMIRSSTPADLSSMAGLAARFSTAAAPAQEIKELKTKLKKMESTMARQKDRIDGLETRLRKKK